MGILRASKIPSGRLMDRIASTPDSLRPRRERAKAPYYYELAIGIVR